MSRPVARQSPRPQDDACVNPLQHSQTGTNPPKSADLKNLPVPADAGLFQLGSSSNIGPLDSGSSSPFRMAQIGDKSFADICFADFTLDLDNATASFSRPATPATPATTTSTADDKAIVAPEAPAPASVLPSIGQPYMNRFRLLAVSLLNFANGLGDSAPGALIPSIENQYTLGYAVVSLIFVGQALGYILAAPMIDTVRERYGRARTLLYTQLLLVLGLIPLVFMAPYYLVVLSFFIIGICESFNLAIGNVFCGSLKNGTTALGVMHGAYGIGGTVGPLMATALVTVVKTHWGMYYLIPVWFAVINAGFSAWAFWGYEQELAEKNTGDADGMIELGNIAEGTERLTNSTTGNTRNAATASLYEILSVAASKIVLLGSLFLFSYQGAEVSISGWIISFLLDTRDGDPSKVGYVSSGFWAGITLGRFFLSTPAQWIGEKKFVYGITVLAAAFQLIIWQVPNIVGDSVAVAILGVLLGPIYPCAAAVFLRNMSKEEQVRGMVIMSAFGSSGGAAAPFTTGLLAEAVGTYVLHPIAMILFGVMIVCWYCLPSKPRQTN